MVSLAGAVLNVEEMFDPDKPKLTLDRSRVKAVHSEEAPIYTRF
jgi:hypothetical protein